MGPIFARVCERFAHDLEAAARRGAMAGPPGYWGAHMPPRGIKPPRGMNMPPRGMNLPLRRMNMHPRGSRKDTARVLGTFISREELHANPARGGSGALRALPALNGSLQLQTRRKTRMNSFQTTLTPKSRKLYKCRSVAKQT